MLVTEEKSLYMNKPIAYLENDDFNSQGQLLINTNLPVVILIQASWCSYCTKVKPIFQEFADKTQGKIFCATIQIDGDRKSEQLLGYRIPKLFPDIEGIPTYILYINGQNISKKISSNIEIKALFDFVK